MKVYSLYNRLKDLRESQNLKQTNIAEYLNISKQVYSRYESDKQNFPYIF